MSGPRFSPGALHAPLIGHVHEVMLAHLPEASRVLDVGCGEGRVLELMRRRGVREPVGIDVMPMPRVWRDVPGRPALIKGDMAQLPAASAAFEAVVCLFVFPPRGGPGRTRGLRELSRVARPGATLLFCCQNTFSPVLMARRMYYVLRYGYRPETAVLSPRGVERSLSAAGWRITARLGLTVPPYHRTRGVLGALARLYYRWISSRPRWAPILGIVATRREERQPSSMSGPHRPLATRTSCA